MAGYHFIFNLNDHTYESREQGLSDPEGYLLSVHRYTPKFTALALSLNNSYDEIVMADNGYYARIRDLTKSYTKESAALLKRVSAFEKKLGRKARYKELPAELMRDYTALAKRIRSSVYEIEKTHEFSFEDILREQSLIKPDRIVCPEDILLATLVGLNIEPEYLDLPRSFYRYRNERSGRFFQKAQTTYPGTYPGEKQILAVASAVDYNSAYDAGRELAKAGAQYLAMGTGAYMVDNHFTDHYRINRKTTILERSVPRRYLRTVLTAKGLVDGYYAQAGTYPALIHFLGLGTPIMMVMVAWIGRHAGEITFDATSPIKDAVEGTLYVTEPSYLKFKTDKLASYYMQNPEQRWACGCTYCKTYGKMHVMDYDRAAQWFAKHPDRGADLEREDLRAGELAEALPLFSMPRGGQQARDINDWRMGHNHMMLMHIMDDLRSTDNDETLKALITEKLETYAKDALPHYAYAIKEAWRLSQAF
ncbi:MAG: hypothetical protein KDJ75_08610 [Alphaproteobacteria bacterium]|nr:hypothetical protein [Alphaproteobacteria bacterium]